MENVRDNRFPDAQCEFCGLAHSHIIQAIRELYGNAYVSSLPEPQFWEVLLRVHTCYSHVENTVNGLAELNQAGDGAAGLYVGGTQAVTGGNGAIGRGQEQAQVQARYMGQQRGMPPYTQQDLIHNQRVKLAHIQAVCQRFAPPRQPANSRMPGARVEMQNFGGQGGAAQMAQEAAPDALMQLAQLGAQYQPTAAPRGQEIVQGLYGRAARGGAVVADTQAEQRGLERLARGLRDYRDRR